jgi:hypothetical protein
MRYKALIKFRDLDDTVYEAGDEYPKIAATTERIRQLSTSDNKLNKPVIRIIEAEPNAETVKRAEPEIETAGGTEAKPKRRGRPKK